MPCALSLLPEGPNYRAESFRRGLRAAGFRICDGGWRPAPGDALLIWNRYPRHEEQCRRFESAGAMVLVVENGYFGKEWIGRKWFAISRGHHNGAGSWPHGGPERWDGWGVELGPWRDDGDETILLPQRGFGEPGIRMPDDWLQRAQAAHPGARVRPHPGPGLHSDADLARDLARARIAVTWASGAGLKALLLGVPVESWLPSWIGGGACSAPGEPPRRGDRLSMLRRLAWAMWSAEEVERGDPFAMLA